MNKNFKKQLMNDYYLSRKEFDRRDHIFVANTPDGSFSFRFLSDLSIFISQGRLFVRSSNEDLIKILKKEYESYPGQWFLEAKNIYKLMDILKKFSFKIDNIYPILIPKNNFKRLARVKFYRLNKDEILSYKGTSVHSFLFNEDDRIGLSFYDQDKLICLAGASYDGLFTNEIGVEKYDFSKKYKGIASQIVNEISYLLMEESPGVCPIYTTQFSHNDSINVALRAGFTIHTVLNANKIIN